MPFDEAEPQVLADAARFWQSGQFESLWVDVRDDAYDNGVAARRVIFSFVGARRHSDPGSGLSDTTG